MPEAFDGVSKGRISGPALRRLASRYLARTRARIMHARRDPISLLFVGGHPYAYDLDELGRPWRR